MGKKFKDKEKILGPAIKILDDNGMSSKIYTIKFPNKHEDIDLSPTAKYKEYPTNVLNSRPNFINKTRGYYTNKRIFISYQDFILLSSDIQGR